jgi:hypothetical protein
MSMPGTTAGPGRSARQELVKTIVEQSWARPDALRPTARAHVVLMATVGAAAAAVAVGALVQLVHPTRHPSTAGSLPRSAAVSFAAVTGWDCDSGADYGFVAQGSTSKWHTAASGGWTQDGCHGQFESIPMTGSKTTDDPDQFAEWWFTPPTATAACAVSVFRPAPPQPQDSAATAAQFFVLDGRDGSRFAGFTLNESSDPGSWAAAGSFAVGQNGIAVELVDRGVPAFAGAELAVTQVKVICTR